MSDPEMIDHAMTDADRIELDAHYKAIAGLLLRKRLWRGSPWRVEIDGCVYRFKVEGYAKHGTPIWHEQQRKNQCVEP